MASYLLRLFAVMFTCTAASCCQSDGCEGQYCAIMYTATSDTVDVITGCYTPIAGDVYSPLLEPGEYDCHSMMYQNPDWTNVTYGTCLCVADNCNLDTSHIKNFTDGPMTCSMNESGSADCSGDGCTCGPNQSPSCYQGDPWVAQLSNGNFTITLLEGSL